MVETLILDSGDNTGPHDFPLLLMVTMFASTASGIRNIGMDKIPNVKCIVLLYCNFTNVDDEHVGSILVRLHHYLTYIVDSEVGQLDEGW